MSTEKPELLPVREIDICFDPGLPEQSFTLWPDDLLLRNVWQSVHIELKHDVPGRAKETIDINGQHVRWVSQRQAMRALPKPDQMERLIAELQKQGA